MKEEKKIVNFDVVKQNMHYGALPVLCELAVELRKKMTLAEIFLWEAIKINEWNLKFRRQHPMSAYIADFYCHQLKLVIELDGGHHQNKEVKCFDEVREGNIWKFGITVLRFKNEEVINDIDNVLIKICNTVTLLKSLSHKYKKGSSDSSPSRAGGKALAGSSDSSPSGDAGTKLFVIKIGGNIIDNDNALQSFLKDFAAIPEKKILIHGGGKIATKIGEQLGIHSNYINGRRITDAATIDLVTMVYGGLVNKKIVAKLQALGCNAIGLTGADANIIPATKRPVLSPAGGKEGIDYGFVGDINTTTLGVDNLNILLSNKFTLVFAPLTHDGQGQMLNTNADTIASTLAAGLSSLYKVRLLYCFEKRGVLENVEDDNSVIPLITKEKYTQLVNDKKLFEGILPKIDNAFDAINNGVNEVLIGDAKDLLRNVTSDTVGTLIK